MSSDAVFVRCPARLIFVGLIRQAVTTLCADGSGGSAPGDTEVYQVQLAVSELVTNIVTHGYDGGESGDIEFAATWDTRRVVVDVYDTGQPFTAPNAAALPDPDALQEGGYGLFLIAQTMDVVTHARGADNRNHWHLEKQFTAGSQ